MSLQRPYNTNGNTNFPNPNFGQGLNQAAFGQPPGGFNPSDRRPLEYNQLPSASLHQRLNDNAPRSHSPAVQSSAYNVNPIIPAKRARNGEDDTDLMSPRTMPGHFNTSRSQTPSQPAYGNPPNTFQHLQHGAQNGISPLSTTQPFSQHARGPIANAQPPQNAMSLAAGIGMNPNALNRNANQSPMSHTPMRNNMQQSPASQPDAVRDQQQLYRLQLEKQKQQMNASHPNLHSRPGMGGAGSMGNSNMGQPGVGGMNRPNVQGQMPNQMQNQIQGQQLAQQRNQQKQASEDQFMNSLMNYLNTRGQTLEPSPKVCNRGISYHQLFMVVNANRVLLPGPNKDNWALVAANLGFSPAQFPNATDECKSIFNRNLFGFTRDWMNSMQKRQALHMQQVQQQQQQQQSQSPQQQIIQVGSDITRNEPSFSPTGAGPPYGRPQLAQSAQPPNIAQQNASQQGLNGPGTPSFNQGSPPSRNGSHPKHDQSPNIASLKRQPSSDQPSAVSESVRPNSSRAPSRGEEMNAQIQLTPDRKPNMKDQKSNMISCGESSQVQEDPSYYQPRKRDLGPGSEVYHGGLPIDMLARLGEDLAREKPSMPRLDEMGVIDLQALTMSIDSGIHGEMRYALDHLVALSYDVRIPLELTDCMGLLEALYDCGEDQLDFLSQHCSRTLDRVEFPMFETVAKAARRESSALHAMPPFASVEYELEHAADRLIAITTILRNFSIPDSLKNHDVLNSEPSARFVASVVRRIGSTPGILRTSQNLLDFMKDIVTLLSNVSHRLDLLDQNDAATILQFLLAFTPEESPILVDDGNISFRSYDPRVHQYLPHAIDSLAKLFARDEPIRPLTNRSFFKAIYAEDRALTSESKLLTRTFALAVAPIPNRQTALLSVTDGHEKVMIRLAQERNPFLSQGMLAGDILSTMIHVDDDKLAQDWLTSADGWAPSLLHLLLQLGFELNTSHQRNHQGRLVDFEAGGCSVIAQRGLSMLKRLNDKLIRSDEGKGINVGISPDRERVLNAALASHFEPGSLKQLLGFAGLDG